MGYKQISAETRGVIEFLLSEGRPYREIAHKAGCSIKGVQGVFNRLKVTGNSACKKRSGRTRKSTKRDDRVLTRLCLTDRHLNSTQLAREWKESTGVIVSTSTVRKRLLENNLKACKPRKKPLLTAQQRKRRLAWARQHKDWSVERWRSVLFSDKSTFTLHSHAGNSYVRRFQGEEYAP